MVLKPLSHIPNPDILKICCRKLQGKQAYPEPVSSEGNDPFPKQVRDEQSWMQL